MVVVGREEGGGDGLLVLAEAEQFFLCFADLKMTMNSWIKLKNLCKHLSMVI